MAELSPFNTIQEQQLGKPRAPWRILVVCALLNRTHGRQVRPMVEEFFERWPSPERVVKTTEGMYDLIRPLGFGNRRIETIRNISEDYVLFFGEGDAKKEQGFGWVDAIRGCGQYAKDSIAIFVCDVLQNVSSDTWLQKYVEWRRGDPPSPVTSRAYEVPVERAGD